MKNWWKTFWSGKGGGAMDRRRLIIFFIILVFAYFYGTPRKKNYTKLWEKANSHDAMFKIVDGRLSILEYSHNKEDMEK